MSVVVDYRASLGFEDKYRIRTIYASDSLTSADIGGIVIADSSGDIEITVPSTSVIPLGSRPITVVRYGLGEVTFVGSGNFYPTTPSISNQYGTLRVIPIATNKYAMSGDGLGGSIFIYG